MKKIWCVVLICSLSLLIVRGAFVEGLFNVDNGTVNGCVNTVDGFEIVLHLPVPGKEFTGPVTKMTAKKYNADMKTLDQVWNTYTSLNGASELSDPQVFVDKDSEVKTQYVYSDRATQIVYQIVGIKSPYRRQGDSDNIDQDTIVRNILIDLGIEVEYPLYYIAEGSIDYSNVDEENAFIRDTDMLFIARQIVEGYPMVTSERFAHNKSIYTGGYVAIVLDEKDNLAFMDLHGVIDVSKSNKGGMLCITWETALKSFLNQKKDFSFETFYERRMSKVEPGSLTIYSIAPAVLYIQKTGEIIPIWEIESKIEFVEVLLDGTCQHISRKCKYHVNAWTGEYLCYDP